jgi:hypothetical protein
LLEIVINVYLYRGICKIQLKDNIGANADFNKAKSLKPIFNKDVSTLIEELKKELSGK